MSSDASSSSPKTPSPCLHNDRRQFATSNGKLYVYCRVCSKKISESISNRFHSTVVRELPSPTAESTTTDVKTPPPPTTASAYSKIIKPLDLQALQLRLAYAATTTPPRSNNKPVCPRRPRKVVSRFPAIDKSLVITDPDTNLKWIPKSTCSRCHRDDTQVTSMGLQWNLCFHCYYSDDSNQLNKPS